MTTQLGIFAKFWQPGAVKTRLAASIGDEAAAGLHRRFVQTLLRRFASAADKQLLCYAPADAGPRFLELDLGSWQLEPQSAGDLGARMQHFFGSTLKPPLPLGEGRGGGLASISASRVVLIGSDSPDLPQEFVQQAFDKLHQYPVVLGPTRDGGYYLIGLSQTIPPIFESIPWSTPAVWPQTIARLESLLLEYHVLPQWYDVDDATDLRRLYHTLLETDPLRIQIAQFFPASPEP